MQIFWKSAGVAYTHVWAVQRLQSVGRGHDIQFLNQQCVLFGCADRGAKAITGRDWCQDTAGRAATAGQFGLLASSDGLRPACDADVMQKCPSSLAGYVWIAYQGQSTQTLSVLLCMHCRHSRRQHRRSGMTQRRGRRPNGSGSARSRRGCGSTASGSGRRRSPRHQRRCNSHCQ